MKGIGMKKYSGVFAASAIVAATMLQGCEFQQFHTQDFSDGSVDLQGKQLYFMPTPGANFYQRVVRDITELGNDPAGDTEADLSTGSQEVVLGPLNAIEFYGATYESIFIGANGTIGFGGVGDNTDLASHFMQPQVSLLPVDDTSTGTVSYDIVVGDSIAVTYEGVTAGGSTATAQAEFFNNESMFGDIALSFTRVSQDAGGVYGLSNAQLQGANEEEINEFLAGFAFEQRPLTVDVMTGTPQQS